MEVRYGPTADHSRFTVYIIRAGHDGKATSDMTLALFTTLRSAEMYADRVAHAMEIRAVRIK